MTPPADLMPLDGHPDYAISPRGEVWRLWRSRPNARFPVPRPLAVIWYGCKGSRSPHYRLDTGAGPPITRSIRQLMRENFPDQPLNTKEA